MTDNPIDQDPRDGEVLPDGTPQPPGEATNWLALISNYTERPDLFLAEVEKHDPGFVQRMNQATEARAKRNEDARFHFGKFQAYTALAISVIAALAVLALAGVSIWRGSADFWTIIALAVFYAVAQSGSFGFARIIEALSDLLKRNGGSPPN